MKIKTIWKVRNDHFDACVNQLLAEGWKLVRREVIVDSKNLEDSVFYAEMILEEAPEE